MTENDDAFNLHGTPYHPRSDFGGFFGPVPDWLLVQSEVSSAAKLVFATLIMLSEVGKETIVNLDELHRLSGGKGKTSRTTRRHLLELKEHGLIRTKHAGRMNGIHVEFLINKWLLERPFEGYRR